MAEITTSSGDRRLIQLRVAVTSMRFSSTRHDIFPLLQRINPWAAASRQASVNSVTNSFGTVFIVVITQRFCVLHRKSLLPKYAG
jgi:Na+/phosphate symporter